MSGNGSKKRSQTDWDRVDALTDETIDTSDIPPLTDEFFRNARLRLPPEPVVVAIHVDPEVFAWFQAQGTDIEHRMNAALRIYAAAHERPSGR